jgi:hypothetical protein
VIGWEAVLRGSLFAAASLDLGAVKIGNAHCPLQHFTSLPAASLGANPIVSHIGQVTRSVFPLVGRGDSGIARLFAAAPTPNGSSSSEADKVAALLSVLLFVGVSLFVGLAAGLEPDEAAGLPAGLGAAGFPPPFPVFMFAPQNGQSTASSSRTDCLHAGQVGSM